MHYLERYKDNDIICLKRKEDDRFPFSFGIGKARLIIENYEAIKEFVEEHTKEPNNE